MKKIKHISELKAEQRKLKRQQVDLEAMIQNDWHQLKNSVQPQTGFLPGFISKKVREKMGKNVLIKAGLSMVTAILAERLLKMAGRKITGLFK